MESYHSECDTALLGADFLSSNALMVDVKGQRLVDTKTFMSLPLQVTSGSSHGIRNVTTDEVVAILGVY